MRPYIELARLDKPIGIYLLLWPSLLGLLISGFNSNIGFKELFIVIIGSILVRSCGCVINDISDFKIDKLVKRTVGRPLASGAVSLQSAWKFFFLLSCEYLFYLVSYQFYHHFEKEITQPHH